MGLSGEIKSVAKLYLASLTFVETLCETFSLRWLNFSSFIGCTGSACTNIRLLVRKVTIIKILGRSLCIPYIMT